MLRRWTMRVSAGTTSVPSSCSSAFFIEVVVAGRLRDGGQDGGLGEGQLVEVGDAEVVLGRGPDAVVVVAEEVLVVVGGDDRLLAVQPGVGLGHPDRLDDLLDLALDRPLRVLDQRWIEESLAHQLLGDGGGAATVALERVDGGRPDARPGRSRCSSRTSCPRRRSARRCRAGEISSNVTTSRRSVAEAGQLDRAGAVVDDRLLVEVDVLAARRGSGRSLAVVGVGGDGADEGDAGHGEEGGEEEEGEGDCGDPRHSSAAPAAAVSTARAAALEARLHARGYVTILGRLAHSGELDARSCPQCADPAGT